MIAIEPRSYLSDCNGIGIFRFNLYNKLLIQTFKKIKDIENFSIMFIWKYKYNYNVRMKI